MAIEHVNGTALRNPAAGLPPLRRYAAVAALVAAAALWGLGGTLADSLFRGGADPLEVVALRTWISLAGLGILLALRRTPRPVGPFPWLTVIGFGLCVAVANSALFLAISRVPVAVALVLQNLAPVLVIGCSLASSRQRPDWRITAGLGAALVGVILVVQLPTTPIGSIDLTGVLFGLLAAAGVAGFSVLGARAARACGTLPANTCAFAVSSLAWIAYQIPRGSPALLSAPGLLGGTAAVGVLGTLAPFVLYSWGTARLGAEAGAVNICLEPLFGAVAAWAWLGQELNSVQMTGAIVLVIAVIDLQRRQHHAHRTAVPPARTKSQVRRSTAALDFLLETEGLSGRLKRLPGPASGRPPG